MKIPHSWFFEAVSSFFDTTSGTMNTDDHVFVYLSNGFSQTQPDGVFQNQINFRLIHPGPTPGSWLFVSGTNQADVKSWKGTGSSTAREKQYNSGVVSLTQKKKIHLGTIGC